MVSITNINLDYDRPIKIADDVYWVGVYQSQSGYHSNTYLIVDEKEAVLIDGGSRSDFPLVMIKIMQTGLIPSSIAALIYQDSNPRFCGSIPHLEVIIGRKDLKVISDQANHMSLKHYFESGTLLSLEDVDHTMVLSSGRRLDFIKIPFAHSAGSFVTFDRKSGVLFSGRLLGSYGSAWNLFLKLKADCRTCRSYTDCPKKTCCPIHDILKFHQDIMTSERALKFALDRIATAHFTTVAPQQGSVLYDSEDIILICELLSSLQGVGIDGIIGSKPFCELGNTSPIKERLVGEECRST